MPGLNQLKLPVRLAAGVDTKSDPKQVQTKLLRLENALFTSTGRIKKRYGYAALPANVLGTFSTVSNTQGVAASNNELVTFANNTLYSLDVSAGAQVPKGAIQSVTVTQYPIVRNANGQSQQDGVVHPFGPTVWAWLDSAGGVWYSLLDGVTQQVLTPPTQLDSSGSLPKVAVLGSYAVVVWANTGALKYAAVSVLNPTAAPLTGTLTSSLNAANTHYDITNLSGTLYFVWNATAATTIGVGQLTSGFTVTTTTISGQAASSCIAVVGDPVGGYLGIFLGNATTTYYTIINAASFTPAVGLTTLTGADVSASNITAVTTGVEAFNVYWTLPNGSPPLAYLRWAQVSGPTVTGVANGPRGVWLASKAFVSTAPTTAAYAWVGYQSPAASGLQNCYFLYNLGYPPPSGGYAGGNVAVGPIARVMYTGGGLGGGFPTGSSQLPEVTLSGSVATVSLLQKDLITTLVPAQGQPNAGAAVNPIYTQTGVVAVQANFADPQGAYLRSSLASDLHVSGGMLWVYDGAAPVEHSFLLYPEGASGTGVATGGGLVNSGSYQYVLTYEWRDNQGNYYQSQASPAFTVSTPAGAGTAASVTFSNVPSLRVTRKTNVNVAVYRTQNNGTIFYRVFNINAPNLSSVTADTVTLPTDTVGDAALVNGQILYTTGGSLGCDAPPPSTSSVTYQSRILLLPSDNKYTWWYSKQVRQYPPTGVQFSAYFSNTVDAFGGALTAINVIDGNVILFSANTIRFVQGYGPADNGANNDFTPAQFITTDVGCSNPRGIIRVPNGLMFPSSKGIYLLDRSLAVSYIGADVEGFTNGGQNVISAQLIPSTNQVRFGLDSGVILVYDYFYQTWCSFTGLQHVDGTIFQNLYTILRSNGQLFQEAPGTFYDNGNPISMRLVTGWMQMGGINGYQRAYRFMLLGEYVSPHLLNVGVAYDFDVSIVQNAQITPTGMDYWGSGSAWGLGASGSPDTWGETYPVYQWRVDLARQKCTAVQISLADMAQSGTGESLNLTGITALVGVKVGLKKVGPANITG